MAMEAGEIKKWLKGFKSKDLIAINDDGMALVLVADEANNYIEVGGVPPTEQEELNDEVDRVLSELVADGVIRKVGENNYILDKDGEAKLAELKLDALNTGTEWPDRPDAVKQREHRAQLREHKRNKRRKP
jgi:hypothetical protein